MKRVMLLAVVSGMVACTTVDPYTGESKTSNAAKGAGIGAVAGAVLGAATASKSDRKKGALTGAVAGGAIGAGIGYYMDRQEAALRERLRGSGVRVNREGDNIRLTMPGSITFATGRYQVRNDFHPVLDSVAEVLTEFDKTAVKVAGHTDAVGSDASNQTLSEQRAQSVGRYLVNRNVASGRVQSVGYGERYPVAGNDTSAGREANRRVELELLPL